MDDIAEAENSNERNADIARTALGAVGFDPADEGIADLIVDLMHLADVTDGTDGWSVFRQAETHYQAEKPSEDEINFAKAKALVLERVPNAATMQLASSDQGSFGFNLIALLDADDAMIDYGDLDIDLDNEAWDYLCDLSWNGVVGEDRGGWANVSLLVEGDRFFVVSEKDGLIRTFNNQQEADDAALTVAVNTARTVYVHDRHTEKKEV